MSLINVVSSLPIRPRQNPLIGFYSIPVVLDLIARINQLPLIYSVNTLGLNLVTDSCTDEHLSHIKGLNVLADEILYDFNIVSIVSSVFKQGFNEGWIVKDKREIYRCPCGRTEFLNIEDNVLNRKSNRLVYEIVNGIPHCKICNEDTTLHVEDVFLLKIPNNCLEFYSPIFVQQYCDKDISAQIQFFRGKEILLSRGIDKGLVVSHEGKNIFVDIDFIHMIYFHYLYLQQKYVKIVPVGFKVAKQLTLSLIVSELLGDPLPETVLFLPYIFLSGKDVFKNMSISQFEKEYGFSILRVLLSCGFGANKKELSIQSQMIHQIALSLENLTNFVPNPYYSVCDFESLWKSFSLDKTMRLIASIRKTSIHNTDVENYLLQSMLSL